jgi:hypothetical protein
MSHLTTYFHRLRADEEQEERPDTTYRSTEPDEAAWGRIRTAQCEAIRWYDSMYVKCESRVTSHHRHAHEFDLANLLQHRYTGVRYGMAFPITVQVQSRLWIACGVWTYYKGILL